MSAIHIHDGNWAAFCMPPVVDGETKGFGCVPRPPDYQSSYARVDVPLIDESQWEEIIKDKEAAGASLKFVRDRGMDGSQIPSRDQDGYGYCWMHSGTSALLLLRAKMHLPYADLSAFHGACIIKNYRNQGGWGAQGMDFLVEKGLTTSKYWPQKSTSRSNDTPEMWADAATRKVTDGWWDLEQAQYDRNLTWKANISLLLSDVPCVEDYNWWGHSVCGVAACIIRERPRDASTGKLMTAQELGPEYEITVLPSGVAIGKWIWNSWADGWGEAGMGQLSGSKAITNGCVAPCNTMAA